MTANAPWKDPAGPLKELAEAFSIDVARLHGAESPDELNYTDPRFPLDKIGLGEDVSVNAQKLAGLDKVLSEMWTRYGQALTLRLKLAGDVLAVNAEYEKEKLEQFFDLIRESPNFELQLVINKKLLLQQWAFSHASVTFKLFLFPEALARILSDPLMDLEQAPKALLKNFNGETKFIVLVPDRDLELNGVYLSVLGQDAVSRWRNYLPSNLGVTRGQIRLASEAARERLKWVHIDLEYLTPLQFQVDWLQPADGSEGGPPASDSIAGPLYAQSLACSLLYMAGHSSSNQRRVPSQDSEDQKQDSSWMASIAADNYVVKLRVGDTDELKQVLSAKSTGNPWKTAQLISKLSAWIYEVERDVANRSIVLQNVIANSLQDQEPAEVLSVLVRRAAELSKRVAWGWEAFIGEKLKTYFSQEKELEDVVDSTTKSYNEQVQTLTKTLVDNMLAAVGVVVGSFIAAMFKSPFQEYVFWFGTGIYVAYLLIFPVLVGLTSTWQRFADSKASFAKREKDFTKRLTREQVDQIVGDTVRKRESWFKKWFVTTIVLYLLVLVFLVVAMLFVPGSIKNWSDNFELTDVSYGGPANSDTVPITIRGRNFDKDKEIVAIIGDSGFTNTDGQTLKVHGPTVLTVSPRQEDLATYKANGGGSVFVKQGSAGPKELLLPVSPAPIPEPKFEAWTVGVLAGSGLVCQGENFGSIAAVNLDGVRLKITVSNEGRKIEISNPSASKPLKAGQVLKVALKNGKTMPDLTLPAVSK